MKKVILGFVFLQQMTLAASAQDVPAPTTEPPAEHRQTTIANVITGNNSEPVLFNDVNLNYSELVSANVQFSKENDLQKVVFQPLKLIKRSNPDDAFVRFHDNTKLNLAQKNGISTFGLGIGLMDNSSPYSVRGTRYFNEIPATTYPTRIGDEPKKAEGETDADFEKRIEAHEKQKREYKRLKDAADKQERDNYIDYYRKLTTNSVKITIGSNLSFFEVIGGDTVDINRDGIVDNYYKRSGLDLSANITYGATERFACAITTRRQYNRAKPLEGQKVVTYNGISLSAGYLLFDFNKDYEKTEDYYKSLFRSGLVCGMSLEYLKAIKNESQAKDGITEALIVTPFLDFRISPKNQFRIGVPIRKYSAITNDVSLGPFLQYSLVLSKAD